MHIIKLKIKIIVTLLQNDNHWATTKINVRPISVANSNDDYLLRLTLTTTSDDQLWWSPPKTNSIDHLKILTLMTYFNEQIIYSKETQLIKVFLNINLILLVYSV